MLVFTYSHNNNDKETIVKSQVKGYQLSWATQHLGGGGGSYRVPGYRDYFKRGAAGVGGGGGGVVTASVLSGLFQTECYGRFQNSHYQRK